MTLFISVFFIVIFQNGGKMNNTNKFNIQMVTEGSIVIALAYVLGLFSIFRMPQGGDISLAMLPILVYSIRWGVLPGFIVGALYGILKLMVDPYILNIWQVLLDYPLPSAVIGISGLSYLKDKSKFTGYLPFIILGYLLKLLMHYLSGIIFFASSTPEGMSPHWYSFIYNISYLGPELIIFIVIIAILWKPLGNILQKQN